VIVVLDYAFNKYNYPRHSNCLTITFTISDHMGATVRMKRDFLLKQAFFLFLSGLKSW